MLIDLEMLVAEDVRQMELLWNTTADHQEGCRQVIAS